VTVLYPKAPKVDLFKVSFSHLTTKRLILQCKNIDIPILSEIDNETLNTYFNVIVDAIFGYSFRGDVRSPFDGVLKVEKIVF
jgi:NAD(P)H-hydrate epimerase